MNRLKLKRPAPLQMGTGLGLSSAASSLHTAQHDLDQAASAARWIARRARVSLAVASVIAEVHGIGGVAR